MLNYFKYEKTFSSLVQSRFVVVVLDLKNTLENSINLGLSLTELNNAQTIIERIARQDEQIFSIDIFDQTGKRLFSTMTVNNTELVPEDWLKVQNRLTAKENFWTLTDQDAFVVGVPLTNNFGKNVGGVTLRSSKAYHQSKVHSMFIELTKIFLITVVSFGILTILIVFLFFREITRSFAKMSASLQKVIDEPNLPNEMLVNPQQLTELEQHVYEFRDKSQAALTTLKQAQQAIKTVEDVV
ncbi:hypothetical protein [Beggiatoa alba]|uniref:hypothetical protein n=1 Tax=Beggiatoa alba TaxID=1022 RepID=UPI001E2D78BC|nr:hypothetical protein [Beggiatoa alba]